MKRLFSMIGIICGGLVTLCLVVFCRVFCKNLGEFLDGENEE